MTPPCGVPRVLRFPPVMRRPPCASRTSMGVDHLRVLLTQGEVHRPDRILRAPMWAIPIRTVVAVRFEDRLHCQLDGCLHHPARIVGIPSGRVPPSGFGIRT